MFNTIGTCSLCGGQVTTPEVWAGVHPPTPSCSSCGAIAASHGPVIPMTKPISLKPQPLGFSKTTYIENN